MQPQPGVQKFGTVGDKVLNKLKCNGYFLFTDRDCRNRQNFLRQTKAACDRKNLIKAVIILLTYSKESLQIHASVINP